VIVHYCLFMYGDRRRTGDVTQGLWSIRLTYYPV